jgi:hypothetical protein
MRVRTTRAQGEADPHDRRARLIVSFLPHPAGLARRTTGNLLVPQDREGPDIKAWPLRARQLLSGSTGPTKSMACSCAAHISAACRQKLYLSRCSDFPSQVSARLVNGFSPLPKLSRGFVQCASFRQPRAPARRTGGLQNDGWGSGLAERTLSFARRGASTHDGPWCITYWQPSHVRWTPGTFALMLRAPLRVRLRSR